MSRLRRAGYAALNRIASAPPALTFPAAGLILGMLLGLAVHFHLFTAAAPWLYHTVLTPVLHFLAGWS